MSSKITLVALLLATAPILGVAGDSSADSPEVPAEKLNDNRSKVGDKSSSYIISAEDRRTENKRRRYEDHVRKRSKSGYKGGTNPSPDD